MQRECKASKTVRFHRIWAEYLTGTTTLSHAIASFYILFHVPEEWFFHGIERTAGQALGNKDCGMDTVIFPGRIAAGIAGTGKPMSDLPTTREEQASQPSLVMWVIVETWLFFKREISAQPHHHRGEQSTAGFSGNVGYCEDMLMF